MVSVRNNIGQHLYSIDWKEGIINISQKGVQYFIDNPQNLLLEQPKGIKFNNEAKKMYEYILFLNFKKSK